jgi:hypothetical protein
VTALQGDLFAPMLGMSHRHGGDTEQAAAAFVAPKTGSQRWNVLMALLRAGEWGCTSYELGQACGLLTYVANTRRLELARHGLVQETDRRRPTDTGCDAVVHVLTEWGETQAAHLLEAK